MASVSWTKDQQKVIDLRNRNILVSAAAGSGKTAVLVERIIHMVTDEVNPINIDSLLIVTFTKAAAAEMRERIGAAIEKEIEKNPQSEHLQKQITLIHSAQITTIDSFCLNIVKNYFSEIDLNPGFRIADENELALLKADIAAQVMENYYENGDKDYFEMIERYSAPKSDKNIEEILLAIYNFSVSYPWPKKWLDNVMENFNISNIEDFENADCMVELKKYVRNILSDIINEANYSLEVCNGVEGPDKYIDNILSDLDMYNALLKCESFSDYKNTFDNMKYSALSRKKSEASEDKTQLVKDIRDRAKKTIAGISKKFFYQTIDEMFYDFSESARSMKVLVNMAKDFLDEFAKAKTERKIIDFGDMEHFALEILTNKDEETGEIIPSKVAQNLSKHYEEILIDEYQDSNFVQEAILTSISKEKQGRPNVFMVGDVKQSIYKFRMAKPELFMEKYDTYSLEDSLYQRIDLKKNFRSRKVVLDGINFIFEQIMTRKFGNIEYDELAALYNGMEYPTDDEKYSDNCELIIIDKSVSTNFDDSESQLEENMTDEQIEYTNKELEARVIASRIKQLINKENGLLVTAKDQDGNRISRIAEYRDIAILFRGVASWAEILTDVFTKEGIPLLIESRTGYFSAIEVRTVINLLKIINNPRQDIPLTAVLVSPIGNFSNNELALIRANSEETDIYEALECMSENEAYSVEEYSYLPEKVLKFLEMIDNYRNKSAYTSIHDMVKGIICETGYYDYVYAMPNGDRRRKNLDMLVERAINYEGTSYKGLFNFIRYIEKMDKYNIDFGEAGGTKGDDNYVRVMTIHKSKGLEFPVTIVAGMGQKFNKGDIQKKILIHSEYGLAPDYVNHELRIKSPTLLKSVVANKINQENIAEELRVLYVALTRAKEKLIITGFVKDITEALIKYRSKISVGIQFSYERLSAAGTYFDLIIPALMKHEAFVKLLGDDSLCIGNSFRTNDSKWSISYANLSDCIMDTVVETVSNNIKIEDMKNYEFADYDASKCEKLRAELGMLNNYIYPYAEVALIKGKYTVSEIKKMGQYENDEIIEINNEITEKEKYIPEFMKSDEEKQEQLVGTDRGTAYHKAFELLRLDRVKTYDDIKNEIQNMVEMKKLTYDQALCINPHDLLEFTKSNIASRIVDSEKNNKVFREKQFLIGVNAEQVINNLKNIDETVLIQGIVDLYFEEDDEIVLLDYKTDRVTKDGGERILIDRYTSQLNSYKLAIEQLTRKKVKEMVIYSVTLNKSISI